MLGLLKSIRDFFYVVRYGAGNDLKSLDIEVRSRIPDLELPMYSVPYQLKNIWVNKFDRPTERK